jgi:hypothetical protein
VNFNLLFGGAANVPCFASIIAETRSSNSETSTLQDFALARFPICGSHNSASCTIVAETSPGSGIFAATFTVQVQNTGAANLIVNSITTTNLPPGGTATGSPALPFTIAPGGQQTFTIVYSNLPSATYSPSVTVTFASPGPSPVTLSATCPLLRIAAQKSCTVAVASGTLSAPAAVPALYLQVTWLLTVQNNGGVAVENCRVHDASGNPADFNPVIFIEGGSNIAIGATKTFRNTYIPSTPIGFTFSDTATVTCTASGFAFTTSATASVTCSLCGP